MKSVSWLKDGAPFGEATLACAELPFDGKFSCAYDNFFGGIDENYVYLMCL